MVVKPVEFVIDEKDLSPENTRHLFDNVKELLDSPGYAYLKKIVNSLVFEAYSKMLSDNDHDSMMYCKGTIGAFEMLMQNMENEKDKLSTLVDAVNKVNELMEGDDEEEIS